MNINNEAINFYTVNKLLPNIINIKNPLCIGCLINPYAPFTDIPLLNT